jgi:glycerol-3-phosphate acyltransferase PlsX
MNVAVDAMGGDNAPEVVVEGAVEAVSELGIPVTLVGHREVLGKILDVHKPSDLLSVHHCEDMVHMDETPLKAVRKKKDASIRVAFDLVKDGVADAVVSAGNSGAMFAAGVLVLGRIKGVDRPAIASIVPTEKGPGLLIDVGANVDCRPNHLLQFGLMANAFANSCLGIENPAIGLLSIGEERSKGNEQVRLSHRLFRESSLNFAGNVEGRDLFDGDVDVIVCDGFVGNVALKVIEGVVEAITRHVKHELEDPETNLADAVLCRNLIDRFKRKLDYEEYGGAPLLGIKGVGIVCHGGSSSKAIKNAIRVAAQYVNNRIVEKMSLALETVTSG